MKPSPGGPNVSPKLNVQAVQRASPVGDAGAPGLRVALLTVDEDLLHGTLRVGDARRDLLRQSFGRDRLSAGGDEADNIFRGGVVYVFGLRRDAGAPGFSYTVNP